MGKKLVYVGNTPRYISTGATRIANERKRMELEIHIKNKIDVWNVSWWKKKQKKRIRMKVGILDICWNVTVSEQTYWNLISEKAVYYESKYKKSMMKKALLLTSASKNHKHSM